MDYEATGTDAVEETTWDKISSSCEGTSLEGLPSINTLSTPIPPSEEGKVTIEHIECIYREIIDTINSSELNVYTPLNTFNENQLLNEVMNELNHDNFFDDTCDSDDLFGFSDIQSVTSDESMKFSDIKKYYAEALKSIAHTGGYIDNLLLAEEEPVDGGDLNL